MAKHIGLLFSLLVSTLISLPYQKLFKKYEAEPRSSVRGIDATYLINLDVRPELWHRVEPILYFHNVDVQRFPAVFGIGYDEATIRKYCTRHIRPGQLGCMLSHLSIYQDALDRGLKVIWVMEDDVEFVRDPHILAEYIDELTQIDPKWDILYTDLDFADKVEGTVIKSAGLPIDKKKMPPYPLSYYTERANVSPTLQRLHARYGTCSMIVSARGMRKVLRHFTTHDDILWPFDIEIHYTPSLREYGIRNPVARNGHFAFNFSDSGKPSFRDYYQINQKHIEYLEDRIERYTQKPWLKFMGFK